MKPCPSALPSSPPTPSAPQRAGSCATAQTGLVVPAGDPAALASAITSAAWGRGAARATGRGGRRPRSPAYTPAGMGGRGLRRRSRLRCPGTGAASVAPVLRRLLVPVLLLACLITPAVAQAGYQELLKDACRDERVNGTYSQKDYRDALANIPADADQYTNCRDVLRAAQLAAAQRAGGGPHRLGAGQQRDRRRARRARPAGDRDAGREAGA